MGHDHAELDSLLDSPTYLLTAGVVVAALVGCGARPVFVHTSSAPVRIASEAPAQHFGDVRDFASARLALVENSENAVVDVVMLRSESERKKLVVSVFDTPGQSIIAELELAPLARRARSEFRSALKEKPAIRGRRPGRARDAGKAATG